MTNTLKVQYTPGSVLKTKIHQMLSGLSETADNGQTKVVELGGKRILSGLDRQQLFGGQTGCHMEQDKCFIMEDQDCRVSRAVYQTVCMNCQDNSRQSVYIGTTGRTVHSRQKEHQTAVRQCQTGNPLAKHHQTAHSEDTPRFQTKIVHGGVRFNLDRFLTESLEIESARQKPDINLLNQKSEWGHQPLPRLSVMRDR